MTTELTLYDRLPSGSLETYVDAVFRLPILSEEEERDLAMRWRSKQDLAAAQQLIMSHLRFVVRIARQYNGYGLPQQDLIQEGTVGLMKAVRRFDPAVGVRLVSFAVHWIKAEIHEYVLRNWRIVKVATTKAQRKLFYNLRSAKKRLGWMSREEVEQVADDLGVKPQTVLEMEARLSNQDIGFDGDADDETSVAPAGYLPDLRMEPARQIEQLDEADFQQQRLQRALEKLDERSRDILEQRWLAEKKATLHVLADRHQVSAERIRQIEKAALTKLQSQLSA